ncbi:unnamed protein product, partial [Arabidopsis halleri]
SNSFGLKREHGQVGHGHVTTRDPKTLDPAVRFILFPHAPTSYHLQPRAFIIFASL